MKIDMSQHWILRVSVGDFTTYKVRLESLGFEFTSPKATGFNSHYQNVFRFKGYGVVRSTLDAARHMQPETKTVYNSIEDLLEAITIKEEPAKEQPTMQQEYKPFGELTREEQLALFNAWLDGKAIEYRDIANDWDFNWFHASAVPAWEKDTTYRIAPEPIIPDTVPWEAIKPEYKWYAVDMNGSRWLYTTKPERDEEGWHLPEGQYSGGEYSANTDCLNITIGNQPWDKSLQQRPEA